MPKTQDDYFKDFPKMPKTQDDYYKDFPMEKREKALVQALDIRKFEIEMYWKRATYFWTLFAATLVGYAAAQSGTDIDSSSANADQKFLSVLLASLGLVFSVAWLFVNKGSKQWQENWENHVDMLEDDVIGPLYKTVLRRRKSRGVKERLEYILTGPGSFSVSGINQIISWYVVVVWMCLLIRSLLPFEFNRPIEWSYVIIVGFSVFCCFAFLLAPTHKGDHESTANTRNNVIKPML